MKLQLPTIFPLLSTNDKICTYTKIPWLLHANITNRCNLIEIMNGGGGDFKSALGLLAGGYRNDLF